ncbi:hypothetical protein Z043_103064 [Scleropages formosus]|uniref:Uncharacterized protein n=1 Tax=Scleropages formosus TaxID=113540 RepID=A0A0N8K2E5_SCLFO|nr:hypothetical protein Z043_103064 [Scleropages formosus]
MTVRPTFPAASACVGTEFASLSRSRLSDSLAPPAGQPHVELPGSQEALEGQPDDHPLHLAALLPLLRGGGRMRHLHHVVVSASLRMHASKHTLHRAQQDCGLVEKGKSSGNSSWSYGPEGDFHTPTSSPPSRIKPSGHCGPFQNLTTMFQSGKRWVQELADNHPKMAWLAWMHTYLVENPLFLFVAAGIFLYVLLPGLLGLWIAIWKPLPRLKRLTSFITHKIPVKGLICAR